MVRRDGAAVRKERIQDLIKYVLKLLYGQKQLPLSKTLATLEYEFGLTQPKLLEYLRIGDTLGRFILDPDNDKITPIAEELKGS